MLEVCKVLGVEALTAHEVSLICLGSTERRAWEHTGRSHPTGAGGNGMKELPKMVDSSGQEATCDQGTMLFRCGSALGQERTEDQSIKQINQTGDTYMRLLERI